MESQSVRDSIMEFTPWTFAWLAATLIIAVVVPWRSRGAAPAQKLAGRLQFSLVIAGGLLLCIATVLPSTPGLRTFGRPDTVAQIADLDRLLEYMQLYNNELVATIEGLRWTIRIAVFCGVFAMVGALHEFKKTFGALTTSKA